MLKTARKYGVTSGKMTFMWPSLDDIIDMEKLTAENARGTSLIFKVKVFGKVPLNNIM